MRNQALAHIRPCQQATAFGALYDVALDIATRGLLWTWGTSSPWALAPVLLECFTFVCTHKVGAALAVSAVLPAPRREPQSALSVPHLYVHSHVPRVAAGHFEDEERTKKRWQDYASVAAGCGMSVDNCVSKCQAFLDFGWFTRATLALSLYT